MTVKATPTLTSISELVEAGLVNAAEQAGLEAVAAHYAVAVTSTMADLIDPSDPADPVALQFLPDPDELMQRQEEYFDPIGDHAFSPVEGIVHRYPDRVLLKAVHVCPVYCRFCFRREMVGPDGDGLLSGEKLDAAIAYIASRPCIWEVILTGGDPLVLSPRRLQDLMERLSVIEHLRIIRIHSRVPAVDPDRVTDALVTAMKACGKTVYVALHANHPREIGQAARRAIALIVDGGIVMVSQTVLLKGINDNVDVLSDLMRRFVENRIKPYYLHHPDLAPGTSHFRVSIADGQKLVGALRGHLSGLCQPTYVLDIPGGHGKVDLTAGNIRTLSDNCYGVTDRHGVEHAYRDILRDPDAGRARMDSSEP